MKNPKREYFQRLEMTINEKREILFPVKIVSEDKTENSELLTREKKLNITLGDEPLVSISRGGFITLDFSREICGTMRIFIRTTKGDCKIRVRFGESVAEAYSEIGEFNSSNAHSLRDCFYVAPQNAEVQTSRTGFRYARIDLIEGESLDFYCIVAESIFTAEKASGKFNCSDKLVNEIAKTAAYTASLCIQNNVVWDGIKRDRMTWIGDLHPEMLTLIDLYGDIPELMNSICETEKFFPHYWANKIPAYSAWYVICLCDYYLYTGKLDDEKAKVGYINDIIDAFLSIVKEDGSVSYKDCNLGYWKDNEFFFDWVTNFEKDSQIGWASLVMIAMQKSTALLKSSGVDVEKAKEVERRLSQNPIRKSKFKQVEAFCYLAGRKNADEALTSLTENCGEGMTGFLGYYILTAAAESGAGDKVIEMIKEFYGGMISLGATSFWEDFDVKWLNDKPQGLCDIPEKDKKNIHRDYGKHCYKGFRHSLCHGWTSGVYAFLIRQVLGVTPTEAGFKKARISPNLFGMKRVSGVVPTPLGKITVKFENVDGKIKGVIKKPKEMLLDCPIAEDCEIIDR